MIPAQLPIPLIKIFAERAERAQAEEICLSNLFLVGANIMSYERGCMNTTLADNDASYLKAANNALERHGFYIAPDAKVTVANLKYGKHHDAFNATISADLMLFCFVYYNMAVVKQAEEQGRKRGRVGYSGGTLQSMRIREKDILSDTIIRSGAKAVINVTQALWGQTYSAVELPTDRMVKPPYIHAGTHSEEMDQYAHIMRDYHVILKQAAPNP